ncbi:MAG: OsmC family protein [Bdellovibrio sp.]
MAVDATKRIENYEYELDVKGFKVRTDIEANIGGTNRAPDPHDYLQVALASCTAITLQLYAKRKGFPLESVDVKIRITEEGAQNVIQREVRLLGELTQEQKQNLMAIAEKCPIHKFLEKGAQINTLSVE